jgi:branched-subunit amino acid aminotransferase/4-amino-4-deoxychorismate lyase
MAKVVLFDGLLRADGTAPVPADDPGLTAGMTCFETLRSYGGRLLGLEEHLVRLEDSARAMRIAFPGAALLRDEACGVLAQHGGDAVLRITLTRGGHRIVVAADIGPPPESMRCASRVFEPPQWLPGRVKHGSRAGSILVVEALGVDEVIWVDRNGAVLEGTRTNVFAVKKGELYTPPLDGRILQGVTRGLLLSLAPVHEDSFRLDETLDELYCSSTLKELCPIVEVDGAPAPGGGPVGRALAAKFKALVGDTVA